MPAFIDSHCHLTYPELSSQIGPVLERARAAGVAECITIATDIADAGRTLELSSQHRGIHVVCGIHPHNAGKAESGWDAALQTLARREDVRAVGEMGLDYHYDFSDRASQTAVFRRQLEIAMEVGKPVVIHCREAHDDTLAMLAEFPSLVGVVFHCFTGTVNQARQILDRGYWLSLTGVVTFKRSDELREVARMLPEDQLMIETDAPYLSPEPVRSARPNEPSYLIHTAGCIAKARYISPQRLSELTVANTRRFFKLPLP